MTATLSTRKASPAVREAATAARALFKVADYAGAAEDVARVATNVLTRVRLGMVDPTVAADLLRRTSAVQGAALPAALDLALLRTADELCA